MQEAYKHADAITAEVRAIEAKEQTEIVSESDKLLNLL